MRPQFRYQFYQRIYENFPKIIRDSRNAAEKLGLSKVSGRAGLYPGSSSCPGAVPEYVLREVIAANREAVYPVRKAEDELREVAKSIFGDGYDVAATNTCEAGLRLVYETLFAPPTMRKGEIYRGRFISPYGEDIEFTAGYGRPFPPKYKGLILDRSVSAGEFGVEGKSLANLEAVLVRLSGVRYEAHGIKYNVVPLMTTLDHEGSFRRIAKVAESHASDLVGFTTVSYDTPGYGANEKDEKGVPRLMGMLSRLGAEYDVPYVVDSAAAVPVLSPGPEDYGADVVLWSTDKAVRAPISGLIVGKEEMMIPIRKALGLGGERFGGVSSHGKALFSLSDPGRDSVVGLAAMLRVLRDSPEKITAPIDELYEIIADEFSQFRYPRFLDKILITKSYGFGGVEINYEQTWEQGDFGIPIFTMEDMFANTNPIMAALDEMGVYPATIYSGNIIVNPGLGTIDGEGNLLAAPARLAVRALVAALEIVCDHAGLEP